MEFLTYPMTVIDEYLIKPLYQTDEKDDKGKVKPKTFPLSTIESIYEKLPQPTASWGKRLVTIAGSWYAATKVLSNISYLPLCGDFLASGAWWMVSASAASAVFLSYRETALQKITLGLMRSNPLHSFRNNYTQEVIRLAKEHVPEAFKGDKDKFITEALEKTLPRLLKPTEESLKKTYTTQLAERTERRALLTLGSWTIRTASLLGLFNAVRMPFYFYWHSFNAYSLLNFLKTSLSAPTIYTIAGLSLWFWKLQKNKKAALPKPKLPIIESATTVSRDTRSKIYHETISILNTNQSEEQDAFRKSLTDISLRTLLIPQTGQKSPNNITGQTPPNTQTPPAPKKSGKRSTDRQEKASPSKRLDKTPLENTKTDSPTKENSELDSLKSPSISALEKNNGHSKYTEFCNKNTVAKSLTFEVYKAKKKDWKMWMTITSQYKEYHDWLKSQDGVLETKTTPSKLTKSFHEIPVNNTPSQNPLPTNRAPEKNVEPGFISKLTGLFTRRKKQGSPKQSVAPQANIEPKRKQKYPKASGSGKPSGSKSQEKEPTKPSLLSRSVSWIGAKVKDGVNNALSPKKQEKKQETPLQSSSEESENGSNSGSGSGSGSGSAHKSFSSSEEG